MKLRDRRVAMAAAAVTAPFATLASPAPAGALPPTAGCNVGAYTPATGYGGVGGQGEMSCYDLVDGSTTFILTVKLWRRDANNNYHVEATSSVSCIAASCTGVLTTAFRAYQAPAGAYHTESTVISTYGPCCVWHQNSGELSVK